MKIQVDKYEKINKWSEEKRDVPSFAKEFRKYIMRKVVQKGVSHRVEKDWLSVKQNVR